MVYVKIWLSPLIMKQSQEEVFLILKCLSQPVNFYRYTEVVCQENSTLILMPPREEEDWDNEIQEVMLTDWENMCFGVRPYGKEKNIWTI